MEDWVHATFVATKGLGHRMRDVTGLDADGAELSRATLASGAGGPVVAIDAMETKTDRRSRPGPSTWCRGSSA